MVDATLRSQIHSELEGAKSDPGMMNNPVLSGIVNLADGLSSLADGLESLLENLDKFEFVKQMLTSADGETRSITTLVTIIKKAINGQPPLPEVRRIVQGL